MPVRFTGGTSGNREDHAAPTPSSGQAQPVLNTETHGAVPSTVNFNAERGEAPRKTDATRWTQGTPDFMPTGCDSPSPDGKAGSSTDLADPGATEGPWGPGVNAVNTPYTGPK